MGKNTQYEGYESFQYLEPDTDYEEFTFPSSINAGGPSYEVPLSEEEEQRASRISDSETIISLHEHPHYFPADMDETYAYIRQGRTWVPYEYLAQSNLDAIFDFHHTARGQQSGLSYSKSDWQWTEAIHDIGMKACDYDHQDFIIRGKDVGDIREAHEKGQIAVIPAVESSSMIDYELDRIEILYGMGIRLMGICYSESNPLATGQGEKRDGGLTNFGREAVERMNKVGMAISISHASRQTVFDVCEVSRDPVISTHESAKQMYPGQARGASDEYLQAIADTGGVIGVMAAPHGTPSVDHPKHSIESVMDHFEYMVDLVGIDHVGFGPDTLYGDHRGLHTLKPEWAAVPGDAEVVEYVKGMENPTESWHNIVRWLVKNGYTNQEIRKVIGGNTLRVLEKIW